MKISISPRAAEAVLARARDAQVPGWLLKVAVVGGGCNGLTYELYFVPEAGPQDAVVDAGELRIVVDRASAALLEGTIIDFAGGPSFRFDNPRARKSCSCGASFEV